MNNKKTFVLLVLVIALLGFLPANALAQEHGDLASEEHSDESHEEGKFDPATYIMEHIADSHEWHLFTRANGDHVSVYLPVILWSKDDGLVMFMSSKLAHGHEYRGFKLVEEGDLEGRIAKVKDDGTIDEENLPLDLSITKTVAGMMVAALILLLLFISMAKSYKKNGISTPRGLQSFLEPVVLFVRDDIAVPNIGEHRYAKFMPYLLTVFFFILINNLMGLIPIIPGGANVTGNIAVTFTLAFMTMIITNTSGNKDYWKHIFNTPGVPWWLKYPIPLMPLVEFIGVIAKPFALMIRLFANMAAGHIILLSLVSLIFIFNSLSVAPISVAFALFMDCLELLVAFLQAYVFTLLSALFIGLAVQEHH